MKSRYFVSLRKSSRPVVCDRHLDLIIASCTYREQAQLVCEALNYLEDQQRVVRAKTDAKPTISLPEESFR